MTVGDHPRSSFLRHLRGDLRALLIIVLAVTLLKGAHLLTPLEHIFVDVFTSQQPPRPANQTFIIDIDEDSYRSADSFGGKSPLDEKKLAELIRAAIKGGARDVAVDIVTNPDHVLASMGDDKALAETMVVWARDADPCQAGEMCVIPQGAMTDHDGIALVPLDDDGVVRYYVPSFRVPVPSEEQGACHCTERLVDSLPRAAVRVAGVQVPPASTKPLMLDWSGDRYTFERATALRVLQEWRQPWWPGAQRIRGRVVLIGGTFREGRDEKSTPVGDMAGVEIMAHIIESEMRGGGLHHLSPVGSIALELLTGVALIWLNWRFPAETRLGLALSAAAVLVMPLVASFLLHRYALYWVNLAPVLSGVWIHQWHSRARELSRALHTPAAVPASPAVSKQDPSGP
jgi:CHASE2 domain-containing sensor protein